MVVTDCPAQGSFSLFLRPVATVTKRAGSLSPIGNGPQDHAGGLAHDIGNYIPQFQLRPLQRFLHAIDLSGSFLSQTNPRAGQFASCSLRSRRDEQSFAQAMVEQIGNPLGIVGLALTAWYCFEMLSVDHQHIDLAFTQMIYRFSAHS